MNLGKNYELFLETISGLMVIDIDGKLVYMNRQYNYEQQQNYTGKRSPFWTNVRMAANRDYSDRKSVV